jgi:uncharacterized protein (TIGR02118 family)
LVFHLTDGFAIGEIALDRALRLDSRPRSLDFDWMILRSGLIQNLPHVNQNVFAKHWREVHGPLAARLPNLKGYVQNHIVERGPVRLDGLMHRIDGISQLWFDSLELMTEAMSSSEQEACVHDIMSFLDRVTLAIQDPGIWRPDRVGALDPTTKLMAIYVGKGSLSDLRKDIQAAIAGGEFSPTRYRMNGIISSDFSVDPGVPRSAVPVVAVLEAYFATEGERGLAIHSGVLDRGVCSAAAVVGVSPQMFISPPD